MEDLERKAEPGDTGIFQLEELECSCGGQLKYVVGSAEYVCNRCEETYSPRVVLG